MTFSKPFHFVIPFAALVLLGQGCLGGGTSSSATGPDGGVYRTGNYGAEWKQVKVLNLDTKFGSISNVGTVTAAVDPSDQAVVYVGTTENGVIYTLNSGESWSQAKGALSTGRVNAISVDAKDSCVVYAAKANQIFKTSDCARTWSQMYFDPRTDKSFTSVVADWFNGRTVYAGTTEGDVLRSDDAGVSWRPVYRAEGVRITGIALDSGDSRIVYVATDGSGLLKSVNGGQTWDKITKPFDAFEGARRIRAIVIDPLNPRTLYTVSRFGLLRSDDGGAAWTALTLLNPPGTEGIKAFAVNPKDSKVIVYATDTSLVFSNDGGATWTAKKSPTKRGVSFLTFDKLATQNMYLGTVMIKQ